MQMNVRSYIYVIYINLTSFATQLAGGFDGTSNVLAGRYRYLIAYGDFEENYNRIGFKRLMF